MRALLLSSILLLASPALAETFPVNSEADGPDANLNDPACADANGFCTLRAAVQQANVNLGPDEITLGQGVFALTLKRDDDLDDGLTGDLDVLSPITVTGFGDDTPCKGDGCTVIDAKKAKDRAFDVHPGGDLELRSLVVQNGKADKNDDNSSQIDEVSGGCIRVEGVLTTDDVTVSNCKSPDDGGCIGFTDTSAGELEETYLDKCKAKDGGGGIEVDAATVTLDKVTIANSKANEGGGIETTAGTLTLRNVTLSKNKGKVGGGIAAEDEAVVTVNNTTFFDNKGKESACIYTDDSSQMTPVALSNSLLQSSGRAENCSSGSVISGGGNLENGTTCELDGPNDLSNGNAALSKNLLDNGGEVPTHAIESDSQAINRGDDMTCETTDARGVARQGTCDSGAFEFTPI